MTPGQPNRWTLNQRLEGSYAGWLGPPITRPGSVSGIVHQCDAPLAVPAWVGSGRCW